MPPCYPALRFAARLMPTVGRLRPIPFIGKELTTMAGDKYSALKELTGYSFPVYPSSGTEARAQAIAVRCQRAYRFLGKTLNSKIRGKCLRQLKLRQQRAQSRPAATGP
jgi:hypothetical protein